MRPSSPRSSGGWRRPGFCRSPRWACRRRPRRRWRSRSWPIRPCAVFRATFRPPPAPLAPWCSATSRQADGKSVVMAEVSRDTLWVGDEGSGRPAPGSEAREPRRSGPQTAGEPLVRWNGKTWRGRFKIFLGPRGKLTLAVRVPLETYLMGDDTGEIGSLSDDLVQAGRAHAIAARRYYLFFLRQRGRVGVDLSGPAAD